MKRGASCPTPAPSATRPGAGTPARISPEVYYRDALVMLDWPRRAFGFDLKVKVLEDGRLVHSQRVYGDGLIVVGKELFGGARRFETDRLSLLRAGCNSQNLRV